MESQEEKPRLWGNNALGGYAVPGWMVPLIKKSATRTANIRRYPQWVPRRDARWARMHPCAARWKKVKAWLKK